MRRPLPAVVAVVAGAFLVLVGAGRAWVRVSVGQSALLPTVELAVAGRDLLPGLTALGLVGLAGVPALAATRGRGRVVVGAVLALTGAAVVTAIVRLGATDPGLVTTALQTDLVQQAGGREAVGGHGTAWPWITAAGGALLLVAGLLVAVHGPRWSALGRRYESPVAAADPGPAEKRPATGERDLWEALDRGEDPTGLQDPPGSGPQPRD